MNLTWSESLADVDWLALSELYRVAPLGHKPPDKLRTVFSNSMFRCFVWEQGQLVGAGRALADGADCAYICDVALLPSYQGLGLGREIVSRLLEHCQGHRKVILYSVPGKESFYRSLGFRRMRTAMAIFQDQADALTRGYLADD